MKRVVGLGGIFFKARDPKTLCAWYRTHLGINIEPWGGTSFGIDDQQRSNPNAATVWSIFKDDSTYFEPSQSSFMINYRVEDVHAVLALLRAEGCNVVDKVDESEYGKFGWVIDPENNKIELWEPPAPATTPSA